MKNIDFNFGEAEIKIRYNSRLAFQFWLEFSDLRGLIFSFGLPGIHLSITRHEYKYRVGYYIPNNSCWLAFLANLCGAEISMSYDDESLIAEFEYSKFCYFRWLTRCDDGAKETDIPF